MSQAGERSTGGGASSVTFTRFTTNGTFTKKPTTKIIEIFAWGGGSGGGSGRRGAAGTDRFGGGGGSGAGTLHWKGPAFAFAASESVVVGAGGLGGAAQTVDDSDGNNGSPGAISSVGNLETPLDPNAGWVTFGGGGTVFTGAAGAFPFTAGTDFLGVNPNLTTGNGSNTTGFSGDAIFDINLVSPQNICGMLVNIPGGGGGGIDAANTANNGGTGGSLQTFSAVSVLAGGAAGTVGVGQDGGNGLNMSTLVAGGLICSGSGGGGGASNLGAASGKGGNGGIPGGGGGGGAASVNSFDSGAGGDGARGEVWIYEYA